MQSLDVWKKERGKIWHRKPLPADDGCIITITNNVASALSSNNRNIRFLHAAFDANGDRFVAGDYQGHLYVFDVNKNRFSLMKKVAHPCTALAFTLSRNTELLAGLSDYSLRCYDTVKNEQVSVMKGHDSAIHHISIHASGRYALTTSQDAAQLWDLDTFQRKRKLNIKENVGIVKVFFLPLSNTIMTCFKDDTIFAWEADTLNCKYQLQIPEGKNPCFKSFAASRDGRLLIAGGRSRFLHLWTLDTRNLLRIIELPKKVTTAKQLEFLPDSFDAGANQVVGVLSQQGVMHFINVYDCKLLFEIGSLDKRINNVSVSPSGRHITAVLENGNIQVFDVPALTSEMNKPPPPLVKVLKGNKMADCTDESAVEKANKRSKKFQQTRGKENRTADESNEGNELPPSLNMTRLKGILKGYMEYPSKYRMFIWRNILKLPENHAAFGALVDKGTHPAYDNLHEKYPIKSRKLLRVLQRVLSALAHWSPIFGETDYLAMLAFPFIKLFQNNQLVCFEIIASVLTNWGQHWFEYFPNPPVNMLGIVENVLAFHDKELLGHLIKHGCTSQTYAWPLLETLFSEVMTREEWLKLFDNVFSNHPSYLVMCVVAYCSVSRYPLMKCTELDDFNYFFHHRNAIDVNRVIKEAYRLMDITPEDIHPERILAEFEPLTKGQYPLFNKYPKFIVDYQVQERERIRQEEVDYLRQRQSSLELQKETQLRQSEEEAWYRQQKLLQEAEQRRRKLIAEEEQKLGDQRTRLSAMNREVKMKELQMLDATRRKFLEFQQSEKKIELTRMEDEIRRKTQMREKETTEAMEEIEIKNMELQLQHKLLEQELMRAHCEEKHKRSSEYEALKHHQDSLGQMAKNIVLETTRNSSNNVHWEEEEGEVEEEARDVNRNNSAHVDMYPEQRIEGDTDQARRIHLLRSQIQSGLTLADEMMDNDNADDAQQTRLKSVNKVHDWRDDLRLRTTLGAPPVPTSAGLRKEGYLNDTTETESTQFSLDRGQGRYDFEENERQLMAEVRRLRARLATDKRAKPPPSAYQYAEVGLRKDL